MCSESPRCSRNATLVFRTDDRTGIHIEDAKRVDGQWRAAGESGMPLVVTGTGETMQAAREQAYGRVDDVLVPNCSYRTTSASGGWTATTIPQACGYLPPPVSDTSPVRTPASVGVRDHCRGEGVYVVDAHVERNGRRGRRRRLLRRQ